MNIFKSLDSVFPCGSDRTSGEVVNTQLTFTLDGKILGSPMWYKRKAWYVNASVNAFHMHRGLVREFCVDIQHMIPKAHIKACKRQIALAVLNSYLVNNKTGEQGFEYEIIVDSETGPYDDLPTCWWTSCAQACEYLEIVDTRDKLLKEIVDDAVKISVFKQWAAVNWSDKLPEGFLKLLGL